MTALSALLTGLAIITSVYGWGKLFEARPENSSLRAAVTGILMGTGAMCTILTGIGMFWFTPGLVWAVLALGWSLAVYARGRVWRLLRSVDATAVAIAAIPWFVVVASGSAEPVGDHGNDTICYHLLGPQVWLRHVRIEPTLDHFATTFPALVEVLYACAMVVGGPASVGVVSGFLFCTLCVQAYELTQWLGGSLWAARIALGLAATTGSIAFTAGSGFIDVPLACFVVAGARELYAEEQPRLLHGGALLGFAVASKYTGLMWLANAVAVLFVGEALLGNLFLACRRAVAVVAIAALIGCPWYIRNYAELGSPIIPPPPGLDRFCPIKFMSPQTISEFHETWVYERGKGIGRSFPYFFLLPFSLTLAPNLFHCGNGNGIALLAFAPVGAFIVCRASRPGRLVTAFAFLQAVGWFVTQQEMRYAIPLAALACAYAAIGAAWLWPRVGIGAKTLMVAIMVIHYGYGLLMEVRNRGRDIASVVSETAAEARRWEKIPYRAAFDFLNRAEGVEKVLILNRFLPPYYLDRDYVKLHGQYGEAPLGALTDEEAIERASSWGATHVLDVEPFHVNHADPRVQQLFEDNNVRVYRIVWK
jgi:hypothetical protein